MVQYPPRHPLQLGGKVYLLAVPHPDRSAPAKWMMQGNFSAVKPSGDPIASLCIGHYLIDPMGRRTAHLLRYDDCELQRVILQEVNALQRATDERLKELCERVVREQDPERFEAAIVELLYVLERRVQPRHNAGLRIPLIEKPGRLSCPVA